MFTITPRLTQQFRYDMGWQLNSGFTTANYGISKGLELVPLDRVELYVSVPPYITHTKPGVNDGMGDMTFMFKYRAAAGNPENGNYVVTAMLLATVPTGEYKNGSTDASVSPTLALGKGWGNFALQGTAGVSVPTSDRKRARNSRFAECHRPIPLAQVFLAGSRGQFHDVGERQE